MKVAIGLEENSYNSRVDGRFGRAGYFIIINSETKEYEIIENFAKDEVSGAGLKVVRTLVDLGVDEIIVGEIGPKVETLLEEFEIVVYRLGECTSIDEVMKKYSEKSLEKHIFLSQGSGLRMA